MSNTSWASVLMVLLLSSALTPVPAQEPTQDKKESEAVQRVHRLLNQQIETAGLQEAQPLRTFLQAVEKRLPRDAHVVLRIDSKAFGKQAAEVEAMPVALPPVPMSLGTMLRLAMAQCKAPIDYRIGEAEFVITTPQAALYTHVYDLRSLTEKPGIGRVIEEIVAAVGSGDVTQDRRDRDAVQLLNGARVVVRANARRHDSVASLLAAFSRMADLAIIVQSRLYEVDAAYYQKLKGLKRVPLEDVERDYLKGIPSEADAVYKLIGKQKMLHAGDEQKILDGGRLTLLSRQIAMGCLPSPDQVRAGKTTPQVILEGYAFLGKIQVTPDRRFVRLAFVEKASEVEEIRKTKAWNPTQTNQEPLDAEIAFVKESSQAQTLEVADGGSILVPLHYRPKVARDKDRWWVLAIATRIYIEDEEREIRRVMLADVLPALAADVLKNPRLKAVRDMYGTPDDKRIALVNGDAGAWPEKLGPDLAGHMLAPAERAGKRLLGIRFDKYEESIKENVPSTVTVTLINAGGSANGAAIGGCTIRYSVRSTGNGWAVELGEP